MSSPRKDEPPVDECKVFVGGLHRLTTAQDLSKAMSEFGEIADVWISQQRSSKVGGESVCRGYGSVTFAKKSSVTAAVASLCIIKGVTAIVRRFLARKVVTEQDRLCKVFVGGVHPTVTEHQLEQEFSQYGPVLKAEIKRDCSSRDFDKARSRGFAFITFVDYHSAQAALDDTDGLFFAGRRLDVKRAWPAAGTDPDRVHALGMQGLIEAGRSMDIQQLQRAYSQRNGGAEWDKIAAPKYGELVAYIDRYPDLFRTSLRQGKTYVTATGDEGRLHTNAYEHLWNSADDLSMQWNAPPSIAKQQPEATASSVTYCSLVGSSGGVRITEGVDELSPASLPSRGGTWVKQLDAEVHSKIASLSNAQVEHGSHESMGETGWLRCTDECGNVYYYNTLSRCSQWELPLEFQQASQSSGIEKPQLPLVLPTPEWTGGVEHDQTFDSMDQAAVSNSDIEVESSAGIKLSELDPDEVKSWLGNLFCSVPNDDDGDAAKATVTTADVPVTLCGDVDQPETLVSESVPPSLEDPVTRRDREMRVRAKATVDGNDAGHGSADYGTDYYHEQISTVQSLGHVKHKSGPEHETADVLVCGDVDQPETLISESVPPSLEESVTRDDCETRVRGRENSSRIDSSSGLKLAALAKLSKINKSKMVHKSDSEPRLCDRGAATIMKQTAPKLTEEQTHALEEREVADREQADEEAKAAFAHKKLEAAGQAVRAKLERRRREDVEREEWETWAFTKKAEVAPEPESESPVNAVPRQQHPKRRRPRHPEQKITLPAAITNATEEGVSQEESQSQAEAQPQSLATNKTTKDKNLCHRNLESSALSANETGAAAVKADGPATETTVRAVIDGDGSLDLAGISVGDGESLLVSPPKLQSSAVPVSVPTSAPTRAPPPLSSPPPPQPQELELEPEPRPKPHDVEPQPKAQLQSQDLELEPKPPPQSQPKTRPPDTGPPPKPQLRLPVKTLTRNGVLKHHRTTQQENRDTPGLNFADATSCEIKSRPNSKSKRKSSSASRSRSKSKSKQRLADSAVSKKKQAPRICGCGPRVG